PDRLGQGGGGGLVVTGQLLQETQLVEHAGLAGQIPGLACREEGRLVLLRGLVPVAAGTQEAAHRGSDCGGMQGHVVGGGGVDGRVQVGALRFEPGGRLPGRAQLRNASWWAGRRQAPTGGGPRGDVPAGRGGDVRVVVHQPTGRIVCIHTVGGGGERAGVFAQQ